MWDPIFLEMHYCIESIKHKKNHSEDQKVYVFTCYVRSL